MATFTHPLYGTTSGYSLQECAAGGLRAVQSMIALAENPTAADIYRLCPLPAGHRVVDIALVSDDLDSVTDMVVDVGIEDTVQDPSDTTNADAFFDGSTLPQTGGIAHASLVGAVTLAAVDYDRWVTLTVMVDAATFVAGNIGVILTTRQEQPSEAAATPAAV